MSNVRRMSRANTRTSNNVTKAQFRALETRLNPNVTGRATIAQPKPVVGLGDFWQTRRVQVIKLFATSNLTVTYGDVISQLTSTTGTFNFRIHKVRVFGTPGVTLTATLQTGVVANSTVGSSANSGLTVTDLGTYNRLPAIEFNIPKVCSLYLSAAKGSETAFVEAYYSGTKQTGFQAIFEITVDFQMP